MKKLIFAGLAVYGACCLVKALSKRVCIVIKIEKPENNG